MVGDDHQIADAERSIDTAGSVGDEQHADTQLLHDAHGKSDLLHGIPLVEMEPALHGDDAPPSSKPKIIRPLCPSTVETGKPGICL